MSAQCLLGVSCQTSEGNLHKALALAAYDFNTGVRWGRHQAAAAHFAPSLKNAFLTRSEEQDDSIHISMVEELRVDLLAKGRKAELRYRYHWHRTREGILNKTVVIEEWTWQNEAWRLTRIRHGSGPQFPLFDGLAPSPPRRAAPKEAGPRTKAKP
ncbi:MAG: hypothetical protein RBU30_05445 [Polyangia bacterium]|nr:hypothetical protein [Polyangia bacterium]